MRLVIDTTQPLTPTDRALLRALLDDTPTTHHRPATRTTDHITAAIQEKTAPPARRPTSVAADAKRPVTDQVGVRTRESTPDDT